MEKSIIQNALNYLSTFLSQVQTSTDSLWLNFATAMERNDLEYLLANSLDSIRCVDCNPTTPNWEDEVYEAEYLFRNHLTDLMHLDNLTSGFSTYQDSTLLRVGYSVEAPQAEEGVYTLVFTLERINEKYFLADRFCRSFSSYSEEACAISLLATKLWVKSVCNKYS